MSYQLVAKGNGADSLFRIRDFEDQIDEGQAAMLQLGLRTSLPADIARLLQVRLEEAGVEEAWVKSSGRNTEIHFRKGFPWLAVIAAIILAFAVLAVLIVSWQLFKEVVPETLRQPIGTGLLILGAIVVALVVYKDIKSEVLKW